jgi:hypothetical protein
MSTPADDGYAQAVIDTVRDLTMRVEEHKRSGEESRQHLQTSVEQLIAAMRQDVHKAITGLQLGQVDHKAAHEADRIERANRQAQVDLQMSELRKWLMGAIVGIAIIVGLLLGAIIIIVLIRSLVL